MANHPIDDAIVDGSPVSKGTVRSYAKARERLRFADANEVRATKLTGHFGGIYISSLKGFFDIETTDTTSPDDGLDVIIDFDGNRFHRVEVTSVPSQLIVTGDYAIDPADEDVIVVKRVVGAPTTITLPSALARTRSVRVVDGKYDANTNNITIVTVLSQKIMGGSSYIIDSNGASITLTPLRDGSGWI